MFNNFSHSNSLSNYDINALISVTRKYKESIRNKFLDDKISTYEKEQLSLLLFRLKTLNELLKISSKNHFTDTFQIQIFSEIQKNLSDLFPIDFEI